MGKPMMIVHMDGSETPARQEAFPLINAEYDINHYWFWRNGDDREYAITLKWNTERQDADIAVAKIGEPDAVIPTDVDDRAQATVAAFMASLNRQHENRMSANAAPLFLADAVESRPNWVLDDDGSGATRHTQQRLYMTMVSWLSDGWYAMGYHVLHDKGAEQLKGKTFDTLADAFDYADEYHDSRPLDKRLR